jgi:predicted PurR-regulated permease PerM
MRAPSHSRSTLAILVVALVVATGIVFSPFVVPLVLAAWLSDLMRPLMRRLTRGNEEYARIAAAAVVAVVMSGVIIPLGAAFFLVFDEARASLAQVRAVSGGQGTAPALASMRSLVSVRLPSVQELGRLAKEHAKEVWDFALNALSASASALLAGAILVLGMYVFLADGRRAYVWLARHSLLGPGAFLRLAAAFRETGRGLLVGMGATFLTQGTIAGVTYAALGVTAAVPLAFLTAVAGLVPVVGTMLVWGPVAVGLALTGNPVRAVILAMVGLCVMGLVDNVVRPLTARFGRLQLPAFVLFVSVLGGVSVFGPSGLLLGPLIVRLTVEAVRLAHERVLFR